MQKQPPKRMVLFVDVSDAPMGQQPKKWDINAQGFNPTEAIDATGNPEKYGPFVMQAIDFATGTQKYIIDNNTRIEWVARFRRDDDVMLTIWVAYT